MERINIEFSGNIIEAELNDTFTAKEVFKALPIEGLINRWGDEIYFSIPVEASPEEDTEIVDEGDLAFWPPGNAFCIFFGPTPASTSQKPRAASPVTVIGNILKRSDFRLLKQAVDGQKINLK